MQVHGKHYRTVWPVDNRVQVIDQCALPHEFRVVDIFSMAEMCLAIKNMTVRGAGLIGACGAYGMWLAALEGQKTRCDFQSFIAESGQALKSTRPTASNLALGVDRVLQAMEQGKSIEEKIVLGKIAANTFADLDAEFCQQIGVYGVERIRDIWKRKKDKPVQILTHCNAGWLAFVDYGSALSPVYKAVEEGIPVHVWVDETRPRNQGASLTAWELAMAKVPHTLIADNTGGHLMQHGMVDIVITGADRVTRQGDVANKIGTYLKALAAKDNNIPFYVAFPSTTFDSSMADGLKEIPIEERNEEEVCYVWGKSSKNVVEKVRICPEETKAMNFGFDVTPHRLITGLITEKGIFKAETKALSCLL